MLETTEAIVLNTRKFGETSKIVTFFTKDFGKINAIVKGAQKPKSKFGSTLEPMNYLSIVFYKKPATQLQLLSDSEILVNFWDIRTSLEHTAIGFAIVETIYKILEEHYVNLAVFDGIITAFIKLNELSKYPFSLFLKFLFTFSSNLGLDVNVSNDLILLEDSPRKINFNYENGSFFAENKSNADSKFYLQIDFSLFKKINEIYNSDWEILPEIEFTKSEVFKIISIFNKFFGYHTEKSLFLESFNLIY